MIITYFTCIDVSLSLLALLVCRHTMNFCVRLILKWYKVNILMWYERRSFTSGCLHTCEEYKVLLCLLQTAVMVYSCNFYSNSILHKIFSDFLSKNWSFCFTIFNPSLRSMINHCIVYYFWFQLSVIALSVVIALRLKTCRLYFTELCWMGMK